MIGYIQRGSQEEDDGSTRPWLSAGARRRFGRMRHSVVRLCRDPRRELFGPVLDPTVEIAALNGTDGFVHAPTLKWHDANPCPERHSLTSAGTSTRGLGSSSGAR
jgi:hypothetical protein